VGTVRRDGDGKNTIQHRPAGNEKSNLTDKPRYVFKDVSESPRSTLDYVVIWPTRLGIRAVPDWERARGSLRFVDRVRAISRRNVIPYGERIDRISRCARVARALYPKTPTPEKSQDGALRCSIAEWPRRPEFVHPAPRRKPWLGSR
jgi:hypothetical protein